MFYAGVGVFTALFSFNPSLSFTFSLSNVDVFVLQTAFSDFLSGSSKDLAKHIRVVVSREINGLHVRNKHILTHMKVL